MQFTFQALTHLIVALYPGHSLSSHVAWVRGSPYSNCCSVSLVSVPQVCFNCRQPGHQVSECPEATETGICFKCGAADHISRKCKVKVPEGETHTVTKA